MDEGMGATERTIANHIKLYSERTHSPPRPPSGTVCGVDTGNSGDLADEGVEATGRKINRNGLCVCERNMHIINQVMLNEHLH